ncbi:MAG: hypothetical protein JWL99_4813 [Streptomyces oryziradicis]|nr:hypothetical protein [Actinacidiphila oryziradicis]
MSGFAALPGEPLCRPARPIRMLLENLRKVVLVALLAASLTNLSAACGRQQPATGAPPSDSTGGGPSPSGSRSGSPAERGIEARQVYFDAGVRGAPLVHTVLDDERELARFPGWFAASEPEAARKIAQKAATTDFSRNVLVGWSAPTGCSAATDAALFATGSRLVLGLDQPEPPQECLVSNQVLVVFEVPKDRMPQSPRFDGKKPDPAGPGTTVAFVRLAETGVQPQQAQGGEVTDATRLDAFLAKLPGNGGTTVTKQLSAHPQRSDERRFGYVLSGCKPTGAALLISPGKAPEAIATGDENIRCIRPQQYAAVVGVPSNLVPGTM